MLKPSYGQRQHRVSNSNRPFRSRSVASDDASVSTESLAAQSIGSRCFYFVSEGGKRLTSLKNNINFNLRGE